MNSSHDLKLDEMYSDEQISSKQTLLNGRFLRAGATAALLVIASCSAPKIGAAGLTQRIEIAEQMLLNGQKALGVEILTAAAEEFSDDPRAQLSLGAAYERLGAYRRASQSYQIAISKGFEVEGKVGLGRLELARFQSQRARDHFAEALKRQPTNVEALNGKGVSFEIDGQHHFARQQYLAALKINPAHTAALNNLALSLLLEGNVTKAVNILSELSRTEPSDQMVLQNLAIGLYLSGDKKAAKEVVTQNPQTVDIFGRAVRNYRMSK